MANDFEREIGSTLPLLALIGVAHLDFMPIPMRPLGPFGPGKSMVFVPRSRPPYDIWGYMKGTARAVGVELKSTKNREDRLAIVGPTSDSSGLDYQQLEALATLAKNGGVARLVWNNGGDIGVLCNEQIVTTFEQYQAALSGGPAARGVKSIPFDRLTRASDEEVGPRRVRMLNWLMPERK